MLKLPFKTEPKKLETAVVGDDRIGSMEIPKLEDLSPNERIFIKNQTKELPDLRAAGVTLARSIADKTGQKIIDVYNALTSGNGELLSDHLEEFVEFQQLMEDSSLHRRIVMATAIIKYRLVAEWTIVDTGDANQIHPKLVEAVADFAQKEESGWQESEPVTEDYLGKSQEPELQKTT